MKAGEVSRVTFTPGKSGRFPFACNVSAAAVTRRCQEPWWSQNSGVERDNDKVLNGWRFSGIVGVCAAQLVVALAGVQLGIVRMNADAPPPTWEALSPGLRCMLPSPGTLLNNQIHYRPRTKTWSPGRASTGMRAQSVTGNRTRGRASLAHRSTRQHQVCRGAQLGTPTRSFSGSSSTAFAIPPCPPGGDCFRIRISGRSLARSRGATEVLHRRRACQASRNRGAGCPACAKVVGRLVGIDWAS
jgi:hypothetical protein